MTVFFFFYSLRSSSPISNQLNRSNITFITTINNGQEISDCLGPTAKNQFDLELYNTIGQRLKIKSPHSHFRGNAFRRVEAISIFCFSSDHQILGKKNYIVLLYSLYQIIYLGFSFCLFLFMNLIYQPSNTSRSNGY